MQDTSTNLTATLERIAILGAGSLGSRLGSLLRRAGHHVVYGARGEPGRRPQHDPDGFIDEPASAVRGRSLVILATPFQDAEGGATVELVASLAAQALLDDVILVDATNPVDARWAPIPLPSSGATLIARAAPRAHVVKGFNTIFADMMTPETLHIGGVQISAFIAGDDLDARRRVLALASTAGFAPVDAGPLVNARWLEAMAHLNIQLAVPLGGGTRAAFAYVRP